MFDIYNGTLNSTGTDNWLIIKSYNQREHQTFAGLQLLKWWNLTNLLKFHVMLILQTFLPKVQLNWMLRLYTGILFFDEHYLRHLIEKMIKELDDCELKNHFNYNHRLQDV